MHLPHVPSNDVTCHLTVLDEALHLCRYFRRLQKRHVPDSRIKADLAREQAQLSDDEQHSSDDRPRPATDASLQLPITCINLLRCNMQVSMPN